MSIRFKALALAAAAVAIGGAAMAKGTSFGQQQLFNEGWKFSLTDDSVYCSPAYSDSLWRQLDLPHDWSVEAPLSPDKASCQGYLPGGIGWYRKTFEVNDGMPRHYIYFEGVYNRSTVYINGHKLGHRPNGYVSFMYDITPYLREGENVLAVRVDHSREADSRWYTGSGIYRDVYLVGAPESHFALWGIGWKAASITDMQATVLVDAQVENPRKGMAIEARLYDADGRLVAQKRASKAAINNELTLSVRNPRRWDLADPYLYTLKVFLLDNGRQIDQDSVSVGLRTLEFSPDKGFALNGRNTKVKGVCLHHDAGVLGAVVPAEVWKRRLLNLKGIGVNAIRMSHNPQAPVVYDLCDELGLLVMDEVSDEWEFPKRKWVSGWNQGTPAFEGSYDFFEEWIDRDIADMVRRDRNHPSIFLWSIGNEVDYPNDPYSHPVLDGTEINQPMFGGYNPDAPNAERIGHIAKRLAAVVKGIDDSRPTTGALAGVVMSNQTEYPEAVDVVGYNYTENRYAEDHAAYPDRVIYGSETGIGFDSWKAVRDNDYIFGQFIWTGTDYLGESGRWPSRGLNTGLLNFASLPKPRGEFRAALWLDKPFTYVGAYPIMRDRNGRHHFRPGPAWVSPDAPAVWNYDEGQPMRVVAYTNAPYAKLMLNGEQVGDIRPYNDDNGIIYWDIAFQPGTLTAVGCTEDGTPLSEGSIVTSGRPYALRARIDGEHNAAPGAVNHVLVEIVDEEGRLVTLGDNEITCFVEGGKLLGLEGSSNTDMSSYTDNRHRASNGYLLAYVRNGNAPGEVVLHFLSPLLKSADLNYEIK